MTIPKIPIPQITVTNRIRKDLGDLTSLSQSIAEVGLLSPIIVTQDYTLLAGERRLTACKSLGMEEIPVIIVTAEEAEKQKLIELQENLLRKDFTREEEVLGGMELEQIETVKAQERMNNSGNQYTERGTENFPWGKKGEVRNIIGNLLGVSGKQYERMKYILSNKEELSPEEFADWNNRRISTNKAFGIIKRALGELPPKEKKVEVPPEDYEDLIKRKAELETEIEKLRKSIEDYEAENQNLRTETETFNNAAYLERGKVDMYRSLDGTQQLYDLGADLRHMIEGNLAPLKFRRCFERIPASENARQNLRDMVDLVSEWAQEMYRILDENSAEVIIDVVNE